MTCGKAAVGKFGVQPQGMMERLFAFWFQQFRLQSIWKTRASICKALKIQPDSRISRSLRALQRAQLFGAQPGADHDHRHQCLSHLFEPG